VERPRDNLIEFRVNAGKWDGGSKVNILSLDIAIWFDCCLLAVLSCHLATENVMKLLHEYVLRTLCYFSVCNCSHGNNNWLPGGGCAF